MSLRKEEFLNIIEEETFISNRLKRELHNDVRMKTIWHYQHDLCAWLIEGQTWNRFRANLSAAVWKIDMKLVCSLEKVFESIIQFMACQWL